MFAKVEGPCAGQQNGLRARCVATIDTNCLSKRRQANARYVYMAVPSLAQPEIIIRAVKSHNPYISPDHIYPPTNYAGGGHG